MLIISKALCSSLFISIFLLGEVIKHEAVKCVMGEGMPVYRDPFEKGRLIIQFLVNFPLSGSLTPPAIETLEKVLPPRQVCNCLHFSKHYLLSLFNFYSVHLPKAAESPNEFILYRKTSNVLLMEKPCFLPLYLKLLDFITEVFSHFHICRSAFFSKIYQYF